MIIAHRLIIAVAALLVFGLVGVALHGSPGGHRLATPRASTTVPTLFAPGTKALSEPVDPLTLFVPEGWQSLALEPTALPGSLRALAAQHPRLSVPLKALAIDAEEGAIRLFAITTTPSLAYAAVISFSSPGAVPLPESLLSTISSSLQRTTGVTGDASRIDLPAGAAVRIQATSVKGGPRVAVEDDLFQHGDRTVVVQMAAEGTAADTSPVFSQIAKSVRIG